LTAAQNSKIVVTGQEPGMKVHLNKQPWADKKQRTIKQNYFNYLR